jgi:hypothetical protein
MRRVSLVQGLMTSDSINVVDTCDGRVLYNVIDIPLEAMQSTDNGYQQPSHQGASTGADTMDSCPSFYNSHNIQGKILWLPAREKLPYRAIKTVRPRADKGTVELGVYSHPVVVISRPYDEDNMVHFHPVINTQKQSHGTLLTRTRSQLSKAGESSRCTTSKVPTTSALEAGISPSHHHPSTSTTIPRGKVEIFQLLNSALERHFERRRMSMSGTYIPST